MKACLNSVIVHIHDTILFGAVCTPSGIGSQGLSSPDLQSFILTPCLHKILACTFASQFFSVEVKVSTCRSVHSARFMHVQEMQQSQKLRIEFNTHTLPASCPSWRRLTQNCYWRIKASLHRHASGFA